MIDTMNSGLADRGETFETGMRAYINLVFAARQKNEFRWDHTGNCGQIAIGQPSRESNFEKLLGVSIAPDRQQAANTLERRFFSIVRLLHEAVRNRRLKVHSILSSGTAHSHRAVVERLLCRSTRISRNDLIENAGRCDQDSALLDLKITLENRARLEAFPPMTPPIL